jgi:hypothetical protein
MNTRTLTAVAAFTLILFYTNTILADWQLFFGDLHAHSELSDGIRSPEEILNTARDEVRLDFCALTDHDTFLTEDEWDTLKQVVAAYNDPGNFISILGYEWTDWPDLTSPLYYWGHIGVHFEGNEGNVYRADDANYDNPEKLMSALRSDLYPFLVHRAHPGVMPDYYRYDTWAYPPSVDEWMPIAEGIGGWMDFTGGVSDGWAAGHRLGIIGVSDTHTSQPGVAITGVYAERLDRESILDALRNKRTFGTTSFTYTADKIAVEFKVNGHIMGSEIEAFSAPEIFVDVEGTDTIDTIDVYRDYGTTIYQHPGDDLIETFTIVDDDFSESCFYWVFVQQRNGAIAYTSPVWVDFASSTTTSTSTSPTTSSTTRSTSSSTVPTTPSSTTSTSPTTSSTSTSSTTTTTSSSSSSTTTAAQPNECQLDVTPSSVRSFTFFPRVVLFRLHVTNMECSQGKTMLTFDSGALRTVGKPWVTTPQSLMALALVEREAVPGLYSVTVETDEETCRSEDGLLIE